jgi:hypothetical protein
MRISTLMEYHVLSGRKLLAESCDGLTDHQRFIVEGIYNDLSPLIEASLAPQQIQQLFGEIEKAATAGGDNRTGLGLGVDVAKEANNAINNLGKWMQNTTPVKMFDQKFEQLKSKVAGKFPELAKSLASMGDWAKENPGKTAAIIGVLTTMASLAGGPVGGAIAGQILKGSAELLKGEKLSTAIGKGAKAAAFGWLTGKAVDFIGHALSDPMMAQAKELGRGIVKANYRATIDEIGGEFGDRIGSFATGELYGKAADVADIKDVWKAGVDAWKSGDYMRADSMFKSAGDMTAALAKPEYLNAVADTVDKAQLMKSGAEEMSRFFGKMATVAQGAATAATGNTKDKKESVYLQTRPLSEGQVYVLFNRVEQLNEGPMDWIKDKAGKAADWVGKKATNLTTVVTADKLNSAWEKAGSPTDSAELSKFLAGQGVSDQIIKQTFQSMKIDAGAQADDPKKAATVYAQIKTDVQKLDKKSQKRIMAYLQKQLGTA